MAVAPNTPMHNDTLVTFQNQRLWWIVLGLLGALTLNGAYLIVQRFQPPPPPYILVTNKDGAPIGRIQPALGTADIPDQVVRWYLSDFIENAFKVTANWDEEKYLLQKKVYAICTGQAEKALTTWYTVDDGNKSLKLRAKGWRQAQVTRPLKLPADNAYELDFWTKQEATEGSTLPVTTNWKASIHIVWGKPKNDEDLPIYVDAIDFEKDTP